MDLTETLIFEALQHRQGDQAHSHAPTWILDQILPQHRARPMVTVVDEHPHTLSFLGSVNGVRARHLGVSRFGQSGSLEDVYRHHGIDRDSQVQAVLDLLV
jgi:pyruvate dehydrogenase E1 component